MELPAKTDWTLLSFVFLALLHVCQGVCSLRETKKKTNISNSCKFSGESNYAL